MPNWSNHGGGCCGIIHLHDFDYYGPNGGPLKVVEGFWENEIKKQIDLAMVRKYETTLLDEWNCLVEVVLTSQQANNGWRKILEEMGFKEVNKFYNRNSGNICHVLHLQTRELK